MDCFDANCDAFYSVMGATGSGKSTVSCTVCDSFLALKPSQFINLVSGSNLKFSNRLGSCTQEVTESDKFELDDRTVRLLDTPGFDDTDRSEVETLKKIAASLECQ